ARGEAGVRAAASGRIARPDAAPDRAPARGHQAVRQPAPVSGGPRPRPARAADGDDRGGARSELIVFRIAAAQRAAAARTAALSSFGFARPMKLLCSWRCASNTKVAGSVP